MGRQLSRYCRVFAFLLIFSGCSTGGTFHYLFQAARGQFQISNRARPLEEVIRDDKTAPYLKNLLQEVPRAKKFAEANGLKATRNYEQYVALNRPFVVWVVTASQKLKFEAKMWKFPLVGSFNYLGWFSEEGARHLAAELEKENLDVDVRGASAFSTLGWFRDPVLSTMIRRDAAAVGSLVNVILHESVHASLYIPNQSLFNESLASFIGDLMAKQYLREHFGAGSAELHAYEEREQTSEKIQRVLKKGYDDLESLYADTTLSADEKMARKAAILSQVRKDAEISRAINNATLIQFKTYRSNHEIFGSVFQSCGSDWKRFWVQMNTITKKDFQREQEEDFSYLLTSRVCR